MTPLTPCFRGLCLSANVNSYYRSFAVYLNKKYLVTSVVPTNRSSIGGGYPSTASHLTALGRPSTSFSVDTLPWLLIPVATEPLDSISILTAPFTHTHTHTHKHARTQRCCLVPARDTSKGNITGSAVAVQCCKAHSKINRTRTHQEMR